MINLGRYAKTIVAVVSAVIGWSTLVVNSIQGDISSSEWIVGVTMLATAVGVYAIPNQTGPAE